MLSTLNRATEMSRKDSMAVIYLKARNKHAGTS